MNITLSDFRNVLGVKNDGNVVITLDKQGVEKANYGNFFSNLFRNARSADNDPEENKMIRRALMRAIQNSVEGKVLSQEDLGRIKGELGLDGNADDALERPLSRRELKAVIDIVDEAAANDKLIEKNIGKLDVMGYLDRNVSKGVMKAMNSAAYLDLSEDKKERIAALKAIFGKDFLGCKPVEIEKFVRQNMAVIRDQLFDKLYWENLRIYCNLQKWSGSSWSNLPRRNQS